MRVVRSEGGSVSRWILGLCGVVFLSASAPAAAQTAVEGGVETPKDKLPWPAYSHACRTDDDCAADRVCKVVEVRKEIKQAPDAPLSAGSRFHGVCAPDLVSPTVTLDLLPEFTDSCVSVRVSATVDDNRWIQSGSFLVDGQKVGATMSFSGQETSFSTILSLEPGPPYAHEVELRVTDARGNTASATGVVNADLWFCDSFDEALGDSDRFYVWGNDARPASRARITSDHPRANDATHSHLTTEWRPFDWAASGYRTEVHMRTLRRSGEEYFTVEGFYEGDVQTPNGAAPWSDQPPEYQDQWYSWFIHVPSSVNDLDDEIPLPEGAKFKSMHLAQFHPGNLDDPATPEREQGCAPLIGLDYRERLQINRNSRCGEEASCLLLVAKELERVDGQCTNRTLGELPMPLDQWVRIVLHVVWSEVAADALLEVWMVHEDGSVEPFEWGATVDRAWAATRRLDEGCNPITCPGWVTDAAGDPIHWSDDGELVGVGTRFHIANTYTWPSFLKLGQYLHFEDGAVAQDPKRALLERPGDCTDPDGLSLGCAFSSLVHYDELRIGATAASVGFQVPE